VARNNFDVRGHMMADAPPSGFQNVTISIKVTSGAPPEKLHEVERLALKGCPGIATLRDPVAVSTTLSVTASKQDAAVA
jgi:uncharacterized OsmC-like protein